MYAGLRPALAEWPAFDWHLSALQALSENFVTEAQTDTLSTIYRLEIQPPYGRLLSSSCGGSEFLKEADT